MKILLFKCKDGSIALVDENDYIKQRAHLDYGSERVGEIISDAQNVSKFIAFSTKTDFNQNIL